jgi:hypothetical protein
MGPSDQLLTNSASWHSFLALLSKKAQARKPRPCKHFHSKAGDGIRTHDVQLGNSVLCAQVAMAQSLTMRSSA